METESVKYLPGALLPWYQACKRDLPWRRTQEPYRVWLSEIMLQQTRVEAVKGYYTRFLAELPDVEALSQCPEHRLLKLWEGLGYYSRARNLKKAAITIMEAHGGVFPEEYEKVRALPGIGDYTAGAICSICFGLPTPAVDGNVLRVISRLCNDGTPIDLPAQKKKVTALLAEVYPPQAGDFTQALMELGATVCGPNRAPDCESCPCASFCAGYRLGTAEKLPVKLPKKEKRQEQLTVFILRRGEHYALEQRESTGLLAGLWQFPNAPGFLEVPEAVAELERRGIKAREIYRQVEKKHIFTHVRWNMRGIYLEAAGESGSLRWLTEAEIEKEAALPTAFRQFWEERNHV